ncbi:phenylalanyl-tRNA synthetase alpha subunit, mitochondrial [Knufia obscura]|uniref:Phenylalanine--tRNA ligase, mitochondrial n=2 Tax=Knufia TaxID=430999 RepID=A0AAN8I4V1_9EURO|nr:phenylalanyl-tRNA synthetase alpha subunit, mitochondrial [Knufia obscura]KAK5950420.1 phenylalanyl-tRNA synthetase alpha subunit, mitochondrial [Knufia fluminis]
MHLARTGAFLRALRSARLAAPRPSRVSSVQRARWFSNTRRCLTSPTAFPEQSVPGSDEVDPKKTAGTTEQIHQHEVKQDTTDVAGDSEARPGKSILGKHYPSDETTNVTDTILSLVGRKLYDTPNHPIAITRRLIESVFPPPLYKNHVATNPVVTVHANFDVLGFPQDHPGRSRTDTYYVDSSTVLRTHTSAHQHSAFQRIAVDAENGYTICADVYRRDSIDRSHFPVFHQMEGACTWQLPPKKQSKETRLQQQQRRAQSIRESIDALPKHGLEIIDEAGSYNNHTNPVQIQHDPDDSQLLVEHLKRSLEQLVQKVFTAAQEARPDQKQEQLKVRWIEAYFPFTSPSFELEVFWQGEWLELLGCGVVQQSILNNAGLEDRIGWAWGIGIERLAMLLFNVPDIRLFWSQDDRFLKQFQDGKITRFESFSRYPPCYKDISFWVRPSPAGASPIGAESSSGVAAAAGGDSKKASPSETQPAAFHENDIMEIVRDVAGTLVEDVKLVDEFVHPKNGKKSLCYRINYRSNERTLTNEEVNELHQKVVDKMGELPVEIR